MILLEFNLYKEILLHLDFSICAKVSMDKGIDAVAAKISKAVIGGLGSSVFVGKRAFLGGALGALVADLDVLAMNEDALSPKDKELAISEAMSEQFAERGHQVSMRPAKGSQPGGIGHGDKTSDLFIDNVRYEIYSPENGTAAKRIIGTLAEKKGQSNRFIVNLDNSNVTKEQLGNVIGRLRGAKNNTVQEVIFVRNNEVFHQALAHEAENILSRSLKP